MGVPQEPCSLGLQLDGSRFRARHHCFLTELLRRLNLLLRPGGYPAVRREVDMVCRNFRAVTAVVLLAVLQTSGQAAIVQRGTDLRGRE